MRLKKSLAILLTLFMVAGSFAGCSGSAQKTNTKSSEAAVKPGEATPRNETLYVNGLQWGAPTNFNPMNSNPASVPIASGSIARELTYETMFMYSQLDGKMYPLLAKKYEWSDNQTTCTITLNKDAHWSDGKPVTADDVVYTYQLGKKYSVNWSFYWDYLDSVTAKDSETVVIKTKSDNKNPLMIEESLEGIYIMPKHIWSAIEQKDNSDQTKVTAETNTNPVASGPYKVYYYDDTKIVLLRNDNYWGKASSMWGKLPAPRYVVHNIYKDNASGDTAFKQNQVDVSQQFSPRIWTFGATIKTYLSKSPYYMSGAIPMMIFNTTKSGLDNASVRKAIAECIDYDKIIENAMSGYSPAMSPSLLLPTDVEQKLVDKSKLSSLQWKSKDVTTANALLDSIGAKKGSDGIRVLNGKKLSFKAECPTGWSDWNAALQIVSESAKEIGVDIQTYFPQQSVWTNDMQTGNFDMLMNSYQGPGISSPWMRAYQCMSSDGVPAIGSTAFRNYGRYKNADADKLINTIATETDTAKLKDDWTSLNEIYLKEVPAVGLMYRPAEFYSVNTSVWKGFPVEGDGSNIPPQICMDGYGVAALYKIHS